MTDCFYAHLVCVRTILFVYLCMCSSVYGDSSINQHHRLQKPVKYEVSIHFESRNISSLKALIGFWYVESLIYHFRECGKNKPSKILSIHILRGAQKNKYHVLMDLTYIPELTWRYVDEICVMYFHGITYCVSVVNWFLYLHISCRFSIY